MRVEDGLTGKRVFPRVGDAGHLGRLLAGQLNAILKERINDALHALIERLGFGQFTSGPDLRFGESLGNADAWRWDVPVAAGWLRHGLRNEEVMLVLDAFERLRQQGREQETVVHREKTGEKRITHGA